ncbi:hypothetical protein PUN28_003242 [Cardiocondyla obscurior]|uniref:Ribosomal protein S13 n=1 Tax=Cardiocondyla obscurior TaxID=286306 RepID=A0AAW2GME6_9HYME
MFLRRHVKTLINLIISHFIENISSIAKINKRFTPSVMYICLTYTRGTSAVAANHRDRNPQPRGYPFPRNHRLHVKPDAMRAILLDKRTIRHTRRSLKTLFNRYHLPGTSIKATKKEKKKKKTELNGCLVQLEKCIQPSSINHARYSIRKKKKKRKRRAGEKRVM